MWVTLSIHNLDCIVSIQTSRSPTILFLQPVRRYGTEFWVYKASAHSHFTHYSLKMSQRQVTEYKFLTVANGTLQKCLTCQSEIPIDSDISARCRQCLIHLLNNHSNLQISIDGLTVSTDASTLIRRLEDDLKTKTEEFKKARSESGKFRALHIQADRKVSGEKRENARLGEELALARARVAALETENARLKAANATLQENYDMLDESVFEMPSSNYRNEVLQGDVAMEVSEGQEGDQ